MLAWFLPTAFVAGQAVYRVDRGSVREYKIDKPTQDASYSWQLFTDLSFTSQADPTQAKLIPLGAGRENEVQVSWFVEGDFYLMVSVYNEKGCANKMVWHFVVDPPEDRPIARILGAPTLAVGSCNLQGRILDASRSAGNGLIYSWLPSVYLDNASSSKPVFIPGKTTRYHLTVTDSKGAKDTTSVLVVVPVSPRAITDKNVFVDAPNTTIILNGYKSTGAGLTYLWLSPEGIILNGETTPMAQVSGLGMYFLQVTDSLGCQNKDSVNVGLYIQAISDTASTKMNESVIINVLRNDIPQNAINPSSISIVTPPLHGIASIAADSLILYMPEQSYAGQDEFVYAICDYYRNCDNAKVLVLINDLPFFIPEAFSPNGDGINDKFEIKGLAKYKTVEIEIFNRWGNVVFHSKNYGDGNGKAGFWDGTASSGMRVGSGPVPSGTYYYILTLGGKEKISNAIYLDR